MKPFNTRARWYEQLTIEEASEIDVLDAVILGAKKAMARRTVIQKRAQARIQHLIKTRRLESLDAIRARHPKDEADAQALVVRLRPPPLDIVEDRTVEQRLRDGDL